MMLLSALCLDEGENNENTVFRSPFHLLTSRTGFGIRDNPRTKEKIRSSVNQIGDFLCFICI
jgi:hypothetical protein